LEHSSHFFPSLEHLQDANIAKSVSLGIIKPKKIIDCSLKLKSDAERREWEQRESNIVNQRRLFGDVKPIDFPEMSFIVRWVCDDERCANEHSMRFLDWGLHELYRKHRNDSQRDAKIRNAMKKNLDGNRRDVFLMLGNFRTHQRTFGLMGVLSVKKSTPTLF
jgi:hypothetical protein